MDWVGMVAVVLAVLIAGFVGVLVLAAQWRKRNLPQAERSRVDLLAKVGPLPIAPPIALRLDERGVPLQPIAYTEPMPSQVDIEPDGPAEQAATRALKAAWDHRGRVSGEKAHQDNAEARVRRRQREYDERVAAAEAAFVEARSEASVRVKAADQALKKAHTVNRQALGGMPDRGVIVWEHQIRVDGKTYPMTDKVRARIDTTGSLQFLRGYHTTKKTVFDGRNRPRTATTMHERTDAFDTRQLFLLVEGDEFAASVRLDPAKTAEAYELVATITQAAKRNAAGEQRRTEAIREANEERELAVAARTAALKEPRALLEVAKAGRSDLLAAQAELETFRRAPGGPDESTPPARP